MKDCAFKVIEEQQVGAASDMEQRRIVTILNTLTDVRL
jgi:hypothetical protein